MLTKKILPKYKPKSQNFPKSKTLSLQKIFHAEKNDYRCITPMQTVCSYIGHLAGVYIPADVYARFQRRLGNDVAFICGSDEL